jgi:adenylosuccinate lyase
MSKDPLQSISPADGRYHAQTQPLAAYFSEEALIRYRLFVEIAYFNALCQSGISKLKKFPADKLDNIAGEISADSYEVALRVKEIEKVTNHDVKAVEYFLKEKFAGSKLERYSEFIHFGLTSQDINNTAVPLSMKDAYENVMHPLMKALRDQLAKMAEEWRGVPMLARTHGQPASPTTIGKEIAVFVNRLDEQLIHFRELEYPAKFGGATGNLNAHYVSFPKVDWELFADVFVSSLGLKRSRITSQIEHYDNLAAIFDCYKRVNTILIDLCRDIWTYISMNYFTQKVKKGEVGSSAMPHKVNPIDFENAEGNLGIANALFSHLGEKLPVSRLQRDLTDSTVLRNIGVPYAHTVISIRSILKGLDKVKLNKSQLSSDLKDNWAVVAEALQTILRREGYPDPYETLKALTRTGKKITRASIRSFINKLEVSDKVKKEMLAITPENYIGNASRFSLS